MERRRVFLCVIALLVLCCAMPVHARRKTAEGASEKTKKREFRGAWIQCVNGQWQGMSRDEMQQTLTFQLDRLRETGVNAIIFQVRAECDALYKSDIEPWSRFLTGVQGQAPQQPWDPLQWMIDECHKRGMELHAWINPYRAKTKGTTALSPDHIAVKHPERVFTYDGLFILNPGLPVNREYICEVAADIVRRYDIDGFHIDDYFYPYPVAGLAIPDDDAFATYGDGNSSRGDWRRDNVNSFIRRLATTIHNIKPWVKFGVSPFGIYRNISSSPDGSNTAGLQNYDDLYADVLLWIEEGWIDYCVPQLYWEIGNKNADYAELIRWWDSHAGNRPLYIGEDVERTVKAADLLDGTTNQMRAKRKLHDEATNVCGTVLWYARTVVDNIGNYATALRDTYWREPALQPLMPFIDDKAPAKVKKLKVVDYGGGPVLMWTKPKGDGWRDEAVRYVVYRFARGERIDIDDRSHIIAVTADTFFNISDVSAAGTKGVYIVTALDRMSNESKPAKTKY